MIRFVAAFAAALAFAGLAVAHDFGPAVGAKAPPVVAQNQAAVTKDINAFKGEKGVVLVFTRSADWCPFCKRQLIELNSRRAEFESRGYALAAVTTDSPDKLAKFAKERNIGFELLSDPEFKLVDAYKLRDPAFPPGKRGHGLPVPTIFVLGADGVIKAKFGDADYKVRPAATTVLAGIDAL